MNQIEQYKRVIGIITEPDTDFRAIVIAIAKSHPSLVVAANGPSWLDGVDDFLHSGEKIQAIKLWRAKTGVGLKESKDAVEARQAELGFGS